MRLPEDKIKEAIFHPDLDVRDTAIQYFYSSASPDHTLMPLAIEAIEKYGRTRAFSFTHYLNLLPQTEQTIAWVIGELQRDFQEPANETYFYFLNPSRLLWHADIRLVIQRAPEIFHAPNFDPKERLAFRARLPGAIYSTNVGRRVGAAFPALMLMVPVPVLGPPPIF